MTTVPSAESTERQDRSSERGGSAYVLNRVSLFVDGPEAFEGINSLIAGARTSIHIQIYYFRDDETGWRIARALAAKRAEGVSVRLLYDESGWLFFLRRMQLIRFLEEHGVLVHREKMLGGNGSGKPPSIIASAEATAWNLFKIAQQVITNGIEYAHRKLIIIDGTRGMLGGMNFGDEYAQAGRWHDIMTEVEGPAVGEMQREFLRSWAIAEGSPLTTEEQRLCFPARGGAQYQQVPQTLHPVRILASRRAERGLKGELFSAIAEARRHIFVEQAYLIDEETTKQLTEAVRRGVRVVAIVSDKTDYPFYDEANKVSVNRLVDAGAEVYLYDTEEGRRMIHTKAMSIDGVWTTLGSANFSHRSLNYNQEMNIAVESESFAALVEQRLFAEDLRRSTILPVPLRISAYTMSVHATLKRFL